MGAQSLPQLAGSAVKHQQLLIGNGVLAEASLLGDPVGLLRGILLGKASHALHHAPAAQRHFVGTATAQLAQAHRHTDAPLRHDGQQHCHSRHKRQNDLEHGRQGFCLPTLRPVHTAKAGGLVGGIGGRCFGVGGLVGLRALRSTRLGGNGGLRRLCSLGGRCHGGGSLGGLRLSGLLGLSSLSAAGGRLKHHPANAVDKHLHPCVGMLFRNGGRLARLGLHHITRHILGGDACRTKQHGAGGGKVGTVAGLCLLQEPKGKICLVCGHLGGIQAVFGSAAHPGGDMLGIFPGLTRIGGLCGNAHSAPQDALGGGTGAVGQLQVFFQLLAANVIIFLIQGRIVGDGVTVAHGVGLQLLVVLDAAAHHSALVIEGRIGEIHHRMHLFRLDAHGFQHAAVGIVVKTPAVPAGGAAPGDAVVVVVGSATQIQCAGGIRPHGHDLCIGIFPLAHLVQLHLLFLVAGGHLGQLHLVLHLEDLLDHILQRLGACLAVVGVLGYAEEQHHKSQQHGQQKHKAQTVGLLPASAAHTVGQQDHHQSKQRQSQAEGCGDGVLQQEAQHQRRTHGDGAQQRIAACGGAADGDDGKHRQQKQGRCGITQQQMPLRKLQYAPTVATVVQV